MSMVFTDLPKKIVVLHNILFQFLSIYDTKKVKAKHILQSDNANITNSRLKGIDFVEKDQLNV